MVLWSSVEGAPDRKRKGSHQSGGVNLSTIDCLALVGLEGMQTVRET